MMKMTYTAVLLLVCSGIQTTAQVQYKVNADTVSQTAEENLARNIFTTFQKRNDSMWVLLYPTNAE
ncbi:MAG: hypothetical protein ABI863_05095 [Ginsengibacter sp.]